MHGITMWYTSVGLNITRMHQKNEANYKSVGRNYNYVAVFQKEIVVNHQKLCCSYRHDKNVMQSWTQPGTWNHPKEKRKCKGKFVPHHSTCKWDLKASALTRSHLNNVLHRIYSKPIERLPLLILLITTRSKTHAHFLYSLSSNTETHQVKPKPTS